jgi:hypothetical protein
MSAVLAVVVIVVVIIIWGPRGWIGQSRTLLRKLDLKLFIIRTFPVVIRSICFFSYPKAEYPTQD